MSYVILYSFLIVHLLTIEWACSLLMIQPLPLCCFLFFCLISITCLIMPSNTITECTTCIILKAIPTFNLRGPCHCVKKLMCRILTHSFSSFSPLYAITYYLPSFLSLLLLVLRTSPCFWYFSDSLIFFNLLPYLMGASVLVSLLSLRLHPIQYMDSQFFSTTQTSLYTLAPFPPFLLMHPLTLFS